jgi:hypothetical protein
MNDTYEFGSVSPKPEKAEEAAVEETVEQNLLDQLSEVVSKHVRRQDVFIEVPERPGVTVRVSPNVQQSQMKQWRKQAGDNTKDGMDATKFAARVIAATTTGIFLRGEEVTNAEGASISFASRELLEMTDTQVPVPDCVIAFFGIDPHVEAAALAIMDRAGYGDDVNSEEEADPTVR